MSLRPLRVTARLEAGALMVEPDHPVLLDGLLAWAAVAEADTPGDWSAQEALPLGRAGKGGGWVWQASVMTLEAEPGPAQRVVLYRRTEPERAAQAIRDGQVASKKSNGIFGPSSSGWFQPAGPVRRELRMAASLTGWCLGDPDAVRRLLGRVVQIGKWRRLGFGRVREWEVAEDPEAERRWRERPLPWEEEGYLPMLTPLRPPYWRRSARRLAWVPPDLWLVRVRGLAEPVQAA